MKKWAIHPHRRDFLCPILLHLPFYLVTWMCQWVGQTLFSLQLLSVSLSTLSHSVIHCSLDSFTHSPSPAISCLQRWTKCQVGWGNTRFFCDREGRGERERIKGILITNTHTHIYVLKVFGGAFCVFSRRSLALSMRHFLSLRGGEDLSLSLWNLNKLPRIT